MTIDKEMVEVVNGLAKQLGTDHIVSTQELYGIFDERYNRKQGSVIPSDYCYNRINNGIQLNKPTVFEYLGRGEYKCLGSNYPYNGPIYHKPKGQPEFIVGKCVNGERIIAPSSNLFNRTVDETEKTSTSNNDQTGYVHKTKRDPSIRLRFEVLKRDNFSCNACGASPAKDVSVELHVDHVIPWSKGGETVEENLQTLCSTCNMGKSNTL